MTMINTLLLGFLIGLKHALEVDHVAAVASLASKTTSIREGLTLGATWGLGHTITLFIFSSIVLILDTVISAQLALTLEFFVGCMLVFMGGAIIKNIVKKRIHLHMHNHLDGTTHLHFHSHVQDNVEHQHTHTQQFSIRALLVGMMHGMAGSAALIVLTLDSVSSIETRLVYIFLFGVGSVIGMALLSLLMIIPLRHSEYAANRTYQSLQVFIGLVTLFLGMIIMYETSVTNGLLV
jgi:ABC-type nickel/cobalt efflux system permease component RcnA